MLKRLRKRETYEELINELGDDPIKKYPNRQASQIENSNFMSQLAAGFQEVIEQNERVLKEKTKELLLQEASASSNVSHRHLSIQRSSHATLVVAENEASSASDEPPQPPQPPQTTYEVRQGVSGVATTFSPVFHIPAAREPAITNLLHPEIQISTSSSSSSNQLPRRPTKRPPLMFSIADDIDDDIVRHHQIIIDDVEMEEKQEKAKLARLIKQLHDEVKHTPIDDIIVDDARMKKERKSIKRTDGDLEEEPVSKRIKQPPAKDEKAPIKKPIKKEMIKKKPDPESEHEPRGPSGRPKGSKKKAADDDEVEIQGVTLNDNKIMSFWKSQSANELRNRLKLRKIPATTHWVTKKGLLRVVSDLIKEKKW